MSVNVPTFSQSSRSSCPFLPFSMSPRSMAIIPLTAARRLPQKGGREERFGSETQGVALHWCGQGTPEFNIKGIIFTIYIYTYIYIHTTHPNVYIDIYNNNHNNNNNNTNNRNTNMYIYIYASTSSKTQYGIVVFISNINIYICRYIYIYIYIHTYIGPTCIALHCTALHYTTLLYCTILRILQCITYCNIYPTLCGSVGIWSLCQRQETAELQLHRLCDLAGSSSWLGDLINEHGGFHGYTCVYIYIMIWYNTI